MENISATLISNQYRVLLCGRCSTPLKIWLNNDEFFLLEKHLNNNNNSKNAVYDKCFADSTMLPFIYYFKIIVAVCTSDACAYLHIEWKWGRIRWVVMPGVNWLMEHWAVQVWFKHKQWMLIPNVNSFMCTSSQNVYQKCLRVYKHW